MEEFRKSAEGVFLFVESINSSTKGKQRFLGDRERKRNLPTTPRTVCIKPSLSGKAFRTFPPTVRGNAAYPATPTEMYPQAMTATCVDFRAFILARKSEVQA